MSAPIAFTAFVRDVLGVKLTPAQSVLCRVCFDGIDPSDLTAAECDLAATLFGSGVDSVPPLARDVIVWLKGARIGGTYLVALFLLYASLTLPLDSLAPGEQASAIIVAPDIRLARQGLRYSLGAAQQVPAIARRIDSVTSDAFVLVREDRRRVAIECLPATRGGSALRGRSLVGASLSECAFFRDDNFVVNDVELYRALSPRIVPGGRLIIESTPWAEAGLLFDLFRANHGAPTTALAALCPTGLMRPDARTRGIVARERERDAENASREFDAEFMTAGSGLFFNGASIEASVDPDRALFAAAPSGMHVAAGCDFGFRSDSSAIAIVGREGDRYAVLALEEMKPERGAALKPSEVVARFAELAKRYGVKSLWSDMHYVEAIRELLREHALSLSSGPEGQSGKIETYVAARQLFAEQRIRMPEHRRLIAQLKAIVSSPTSGGGLVIKSPRRNGAHGDICSALVLAIHGASMQRRTTFTGAVTHHREFGSSVFGDETAGNSLAQQIDDIMERQGLGR